MSPGSVGPLANYAGIGIGSLIGAAFSGPVRAVAVSVTGDVGRGVESARPGQGGPSRRSGAARHTDGLQHSAVVAGSGLGSVCCWVGGRVVVHTTCMYVMQ